MQYNHRAYYLDVQKKAKFQTFSVIGTSVEVFGTFGNFLEADSRQPDTTNFPIKNWQLELFNLQSDVREIVTSVSLVWRT